MSRVAANGVELEYEVVWDAQGETLLLIMGLGQPLVVWPLLLDDTDAFIAGHIRPSLP